MSGSAPPKLPQFVRIRYPIIAGNTENFSVTPGPSQI